MRFGLARLAAAGWFASEGEPRAAAAGTGLVELAAELGQRSIERSLGSRFRVRHRGDGSLAIEFARMQGPRSRRHGPEVGQLRLDERPITE